MLTYLESQCLHLSKLFDNKTSIGQNLGVLRCMRILFAYIIWGLKALALITVNAILIHHVISGEDKTVASFCTYV